MTATWTAPRTWATNELVTAALLNEQLRDNLDFLKAPPTALVNVDEASNYTTTSTSFTDVDSGGDPDLSLEITTAGGDVLIGFSGSIAPASGSVGFLDVYIDTARLGGNDGLVAVTGLSSGPPTPASFVVLKQGLAPGLHTFKLQWRTTSGTLTMHAGAGTSDRDLHPQFWVREVS